MIEEIDLKIKKLIISLCFYIAFVMPSIGIANETVTVYSNNKTAREAFVLFLHVELPALQPF